MPKVYLYGLNGGKRIEVTDGWYAAGNPAFSDDGKFLVIYLGARLQAHLRVGRIRQCLPRHGTRLFSRPSLKATESPLKPRSDEVGQNDKKDETPGDKSEARGQEGRAQKARAHGRGRGWPEGSHRRPAHHARRLPHPAPRRRPGLLSAHDRRQTIPATARRPIPMPRSPPSRAFSLKDRKETVLGKVSGYDITRDGKKTARQGRQGLRHRRPAQGQARH